MKQKARLMLAIAIGMISIMACKKDETEQDKSNCYLCRAIYNNGTVVKKELCTATDKTNFRNENAGAEIDCP
jgi:hypothetical protein